MLEIISGLMFGVGLAMFEWGLNQRKARLEVERKKKSKGYVGYTCPTPIKDDYEECLEDLMFETGYSDEELDEIMPDIQKDIEDYI